MEHYPIVTEVNPSGVFDEIHQVVLDGKSDIMATLVESGKYSFINTPDTTTNAFYVIIFTSEAYTLQDNTKIDGQIITSGELFVKSQYICFMQVDTNWYWNQHPQMHIIIVATRTILHPLLEVNAVTYFDTIPTSVSTRTQAKNSISRQPICLTDSNYDR